VNAPRAPRRAAPVDVDDQRPVIDVLMAPATHGGAHVERIDTHSAIVFLAGGRALKLKRAVHFDYVDFSTPALRKAACEAEIRINRRTAPGIYRGVVPVTREPNGSLALDGRGQPVEWLVDMARFDQEGLFDRLAARGSLGLDLMALLGRAIAALHTEAEVRSDHGGRAGMAWVIDGNAMGFEQQGKGALDHARAAALTTAARAALATAAPLLEQRRRAGFVRQCHGDLHLRNIVLIDGRPTLFDAIEFNDEIACVDVAYDLAFLLMDLWRRDLPAHANAVLNAWLLATHDVESLGLLPLFLSCRAAVRAKTSATAAGLQRDAARRGELRALARRYLTLAHQMLTPAPPLVVAIGGFSGSGKSTLARALAPRLGRPPGAALLRSDEVRKSLCGVDALQPLGPEAYTPAMTLRVYRRLMECATTAARSGHAVIVDAVFAQPSDRAAVESVAAQCDVPFVGLWLEAPTGVLAERTERRGPDASDADRSIVEQQVERGAGGVRWRAVDASRTPDEVCDRAYAAVRRATAP